MNSYDDHYERFKREHTQELDRRYAAWKQANQRDMTASETPADQAPRYENFLESFGRAISEVVTVPAGPDAAGSRRG